MQRRAFLASVAVFGIASCPAVADDGIVHIEGFLVFDREIQFPPQTDLSIFATHSWGMQHGEGTFVGEKADIANSELPWGFRLAARSQDLFADELPVIIAAAVQDKDGRDFFYGYIRDLPHNLIGKRLRIEMSYSR